MKPRKFPVLKEGISTKVNAGDLMALKRYGGWVKIINRLKEPLFCNKIDIAKTISQINPIQVAVPVVVVLLLLVPIHLRLLAIISSCFEEWMLQTISSSFLARVFVFH